MLDVLLFVSAGVLLQIRKPERQSVQLEPELAAGGSIQVSRVLVQGHDVPEVPLVGVEEIVSIQVLAVLEAVVVGAVGTGIPQRPGRCGRLGHAARIPQTGVILVSPHANDRIDFLVQLVEPRRNAERVGHESILVQGAYIHDQRQALVCVVERRGVELEELAGREICPVLGQHRSERRPAGLSAAGRVAQRDPQDRLPGPHVDGVQLRVDLIHQQRSDQSTVIVPLRLPDRGQLIRDVRLRGKEPAAGVGARYDRSEAPRSGGQAHPYTRGALEVIDPRDASPVGRRAGARQLAGESDPRLDIRADAGKGIGEVVERPRAEVEPGHGSTQLHATGLQPDLRPCEDRTLLLEQADHVHLAPLAQHVLAREAQYALGANLEERLLLEPDGQIRILRSREQIAGAQQGQLPDVVVDRVVLARRQLVALEHHFLASFADADGPERKGTLSPQAASTELEVQAVQEAGGTLLVDWIVVDLQVPIRVHERKGLPLERENAIALNGRRILERLLGREHQVDTRDHRRAREISARAGPPNATEVEQVVARLVVEAEDLEERILRVLEVPDNGTGLDRSLGDDEPDAALLHLVGARDAIDVVHLAVPRDPTGPVGLSILEQLQPRKVP